MSRTLRLSLALLLAACGDASHAPATAATAAPIASSVASGEPSGAVATGVWPPAAELPPCALPAGVALPAAGFVPGGCGGAAVIWR